MAKGKKEGPKPELHKVASVVSPTPSPTPETHNATAWFDAATQTLMTKATFKIFGNKLSKLSEKEAKARTRQLATSADRTGISFSGAAFQAEYYSTKFKRRGTLCHQVLEDLVATIAKNAQSSASSTFDWSDKLSTFYINSGNPTGKDGTPKSSDTNVAKVLHKYSGREMVLFRELFRRYKISEDDQVKYQLPRPTCCLGNIPSVQKRMAPVTRSEQLRVRVCSFGGGPGTDASGLVWFQKQHPELKFDCVLYDNETTWKRYMKTLQSIFGEEVIISFKKCDVTQCLPLSEDEK